MRVHVRDVCFRGIVSIMLPVGVHLDVHDDVSIGVDSTVTIVRTYTFTNGTGDSVSFKWKRREYVPSDICDVYVQKPGVAIGKSAGADPVLEWDLPSTVLELEDTASVCITFTCPNLIQLNPIQLTLRYRSTSICTYSFAIRSPFGGLIHPDDCTLNGTPSGENLALILDHDGVLRTDHSARVSARAGECSLIIEKSLALPSKIPLLQY